MAARIKVCVRPRIFVLLLIFFLPIVSHAEVAVIGNKNITSNSVTSQQAKKLWLGKLKKLPGANKIKVIDQPVNSAAHIAFYRDIVKKKPAQLKAYWAKVMFTGKAFPPEQLADDAAVVEWVASTPGALGYVDSSAVNDSVKSLLTAK